MLNAYSQFVVGNKIIIPHGVTEIGDYAFECCEDIISISIPSSIKRIGENAFSGSFRLTSIEIPWSVERIGNGAFSYCPMLSSISVDDGNKFYFSAGNSIIDRISGDKLVVGCSSTRIPSYIREIGAYAFLGCTSLNSIALPNSVKYISEGAFMRCNLSDVDLVFARLGVPRSAVVRVYLESRSHSVVLA